MKREQLLGKDTLAKKMSRIQEELGANTTESTTKSSLSLNKTSPKLFISGKLNRKKHKYTLHSLALLDSIEKDIEKYCRGGENAILNYLIKEGLKGVKKLGTMINITTADIEINE